MVHALRQTHRILKTDGQLIDIHPESRLPIVSLCRGAETVIQEPKVIHYLDDLKAADKALDIVVSEGLYSIEEQVPIDFITTADSATEMWGHLRDISAYDDPDAWIGIEEEDRAQLDRFRMAAEQTGPGVEIQVTEPARIRRLRPLPIQSDSPS